MRSVATPDDTAGSQVAFHVFTSSIPVTPWALVKRENLRHWSQPFGRVIPCGAATACAVTSLVIFASVACCAACRSSCAAGDGCEDHQRGHSASPGYYHSKVANE